MTSDYGLNGPIGLRSGRYDYYIMKSGLDAALKLPLDNASRDPLVEAALIAAQNGQTSVVTIYNTLGTSRLRGTDVAGFAEWANRLDQRMIALGLKDASMAVDLSRFIYLILMDFDDVLSGVTPTPTPSKTTWDDTASWDDTQTWKDPA